VRSNPQDRARSSPSRPIPPLHPNLMAIADGKKADPRRNQRLLGRSGRTPLLNKRPQARTVRPGSTFKDPCTPAPPAFSPGRSPAEGNLAGSSAAEPGSTCGHHHPVINDNGSPATTGGQNPGGKTQGGRSSTGVNRVVATPCSAPLGEEAQGGVRPCGRQATKFNSTNLNWTWAPGCRWRKATFPALLGTQQQRGGAAIGREEATRWTPLKEAMMSARWATTGPEEGPT